MTRSTAHRIKPDSYYDELLLQWEERFSTAPVTKVAGHPVAAPPQESKSEGLMIGNMTSRPKVARLSRPCPKSPDGIHDTIKRGMNGNGRQMEKCKLCKVTGLLPRKAA